MKPLALIVLAACGADAVSLEPIYELPTDEDAIPSTLDNLVLSIARAGSDVDLASRSFAPGQGAELAKVPFGDDLVVHLSGTFLGSPVAYGRTCTFSVSNDEVPRPRLWFARNVKFASLALAPGAHAAGAAIDHDGGAMLIGGDGDTSIEFFDPRNGSLSPLGTVTPRRGGTAVRFGIGGEERIALLGGDTPVLELVDTRGAGQARIDALSAPQLARMNATVSSLTDGRVVMIGGTTQNEPVLGTIVEIESRDSAIRVDALPATLARPRHGHTATRLGDDVGAPVLIVGGLDASGPVALAELFRPLTRDLANPAIFAPMLSVPRYGHRAELMPDGSVLVIGGLDVANQPVLEVERFTVDSGFSIVDMLDVGSGVIDISTVRLPDGRILITGGRATLLGAPVAIAQIARLDVFNGSVDTVGTDVMASARAGHFSVLLCDGTIWISGGTSSGPIAERYNPPETARR